MSIDAEGENPGASSLDDASPKASAHRAGAGAGDIKSRALITIEHESAKPRGFALRPTQGMIAAAVALVLGGGFMASAEIFGSKTAQTAVVAQAAPPVDPTAQLLQKVQDEVHTLKVSVDSMRATNENSRQDDAIRALKKSVDILKQDLEVAKASNAGAVAQLGTKLDRLDHDPNPKLAEISARLDRLDRSDRGDKDQSPKLAEIAARLDQLKSDPSSGKLAEITARLDRIEKQISSPAPVASITPPPRPASAAPAPAPVQTASAEPKTPAKPATVDGWMLRDVYGGVALVEGRSGGMREIAPGQYLPGVGEVRSIERRGRSWVVVTSRGIIEADNRW